jgi:hypothetical protein
MSTRLHTINRLSPYKSYNSDTVAAFSRTIDVMAAYPNTLGLFVADMLVNNENTISVAPVIKTTIRDVKRYMALRSTTTGQRVLPIGYNAATTGARDKMIMEYFCSGETAGSIDFWTVRATRAM